ncbi:MAG: TonB family protein [Myxococcota bacterium]
MSSSSNNSILAREREGNAALWVALAVSALLHVPLLMILPGSVEHDGTLERTEFNAANEFSVSVVDTPSEEDEQEQENDELDGTFISAPAPEEEERPEEARFRDQFDSKTDQEMVKPSPNNEREAPSNPVQDQGGQAAQLANRGSESAREAADRNRAEERMRRQTSEREVEEREPGEDADENETQSEETTTGEESEFAEKAEAEEGMVQAEKEGTTKKSIDPKELFPSYADASGVAGSGGSMDYMRDVPEGNKNLLNRKRSRYWSFMDRIRRQVEQTWSPVAEYRKRDPTGDVYGVKDKVSILGVTLNGDGAIRKIYVAHPSGLDFYDDEAVRAIRAASPFPNPPEGIKDQDGLIHFNFMFVLNIDSGGGPLLRIRRR